MEDKIKKYHELKKNLEMIYYAEFVLNFDEATVCPKKDKEHSLEVLNYFAKQGIEITLSDEYYNLLGELINNPVGLSEIELKSIKKEYKNLTKDRKIPKELIFEGMDIADKCYLDWQNAHKTINFTEFEESLDKLVEYNKKTVKYLENPYYGYDVLLDSMENDFSAKMYDEFFGKLEKEIYPLLKQILAKPKKYNEAIKDVKFDIDKQKKITKIICDAMGYTDEVGYVGETLHPFTNWANHNDVRTTTKYDEKLLFSNIFSVMHEVGHATYQIQTDEKFDNTALFDVDSCVLHESQSRFYENYMGRSKEFISWLYPILKEYFKEELAPFTFDDVYYYVNDVTAQFTRTEADELTYPFHVLIRYKIEKMLFNNEIKACDIDKVFNDLMEKYLGIRPTNKLEGCFQDVHWSSGFGYFPTYAVGSAFGAQVLASMEKNFNPYADLAKGDFTQINKWLKEHIHHLAGSEKNFDVIKMATGEELNYDYYIDYLKKKFKEIYNI